MNVLYILKHFPCQSQTFVLNEITELINKGCSVYIVSATDLKEDIVHESIQTYALTTRTSYLEYDYLYPYAPTKKYTQNDVIEKAVYILASENRDISPDEHHKLLNILTCHEKDPASILRGFLECVKVISLIRKVGIEHIHCDFAEDNVKLAYIVNQVTGIPFTFKMRAYDIFSEPENDLLLWASTAKRVLTISQYNKKYIYHTFNIPLEKISVIRDGIYVDKIRPIENFTRSPFKILSVSRLVEKKGYPYLLEACRVLRNQDIGFACEIYGDGPMQQPLQQQIDHLGLNNVVTLAGSRSHQEILDIMDTGSVLVLPCIQAANGDRDGTPNVLMEAMAKELPVISTKISGIPEIVDHEINGLLVKPNHAGALAEAILEVYTHPDLAEALRKEGRRKVENLFTIEQNVEEFLSIVRD